MAELSDDDLRAILPDGWTTTMTPDPEGSLATLYDETCMLDFARAAIAADRALNAAQAAAEPVANPNDPQWMAFVSWAQKRWGSETWRHTSNTCGEWDAWQAGRLAERAAIAAPPQQAAPAAPADIDQQAAVEFYRLNPSAAVLDLRRRLDAPLRVPIASALHRRQLMPAASVAGADWRGVISEAHSRLADATSSAFDNSGYREFAGIVLDAVADELAALERAFAAPASPVAPAEPAGWQPLKYATALDLLMAVRRNRDEFVFHYHGEQKPVVACNLGDGCVWVSDGRMLPVHIYPDGSSKDGPAIWLAAAPQPAPEPAKDKP